MSSGKDMIIHLMTGLIKMILYKNQSILSKTISTIWWRYFNVKVDLTNYATKADIKNISHVATSSFVLKSNLASLKTEVDKLHIDKLLPVPVNLSKLSDVVKNDVFKKAVYDKLAEKVNNISTSNLF